MKAVSREAVLDEFDKWVNSREKYYEHPAEFARSIMSLPPVTPERPKGEWKSDGPGHIYCTACNQTHVSLWKSPLCPNCGADMRGGKE